MPAIGTILARVSLAAALLSGTACLARADGAAPCFGFGALGDHPTLGLARVTGPARSPFVAGAEVSASCPGAAPRCHTKAFLIPGDRVVVDRTQGAFSCVDYVGRHGAGRAGWIATASLAAEPVRPVAAADWRGHWSAIESRIDIRDGAAGRLAITGDATSGSLDPERVKTGAINVGEIKASVAPQGHALAFAMGDDGATLPVTAGDPYACRVWMRRLGPYLLADDNNGCGGLNVSFRGLYGRGP